MSTSPLSRREREKQRQRQDILAAALNLFSEKGYHSVSMQEIAERSEFAIGTLYKFFKGKAELYNALLVEQAISLHDEVMKTVEEIDDDVERLRRYVQVNAKVFQRHASFLRLYFIEIRGASYNLMAGIDHDLRKQYDAFLLDTTAIIERGIRNKRFNPIAAPQDIALALDSILFNLLFRWVENPENHSRPIDPDIILNILFKGLIDPS